MSLWTPGGEVPVERNRAARARPRSTKACRTGRRSDLDDLSPEERAQAEEMIAEMAEVQRQVLAAPAAQVVANHSPGFYELAAIHLRRSRRGSTRPSWPSTPWPPCSMPSATAWARTASPLRDALTQLQMAFVQRKNEAEPRPDEAGLRRLRPASGPAASHRPRRPGTTSNATAAPTSMVRVPSAMAVQWKKYSVAVVGAHRAVARGVVERSTTSPVRSRVSGRSWRSAAR